MAKGILALVGARKDEDGEPDDGESGSPKSRAMREMHEAMKSGDYEAAGHAFERAYKICKARAGSESSGAGEDYEDDDMEG